MCNNSKRVKWRWENGKITIFKRKSNKRWTFNRTIWIKKGLEKGKEEGEEKEKLRIAKKLLKERKNIKYIAELTEIDEEELRKLK